MLIYLINKYKNFLFHSILAPNVSLGCHGLPFYDFVLYSRVYFHKCLFGLQYFMVLSGVGFNILYVKQGKM